MKKIYVAIFLVATTAGSQAQTFNLLANDPQGDVSVSYIGDIASLHYSTSLAQDSLWFRVETYNAMSPNGDAGLLFGLDTNLNPADGLTWSGANSFMNFDVALVVFQNIIFPTYYGYIYSTAGSVPVPVTVLRPDSFTFIISVQHSLLDTDGNFNLLFGTGSFDILSTLDVFDEIPNTGFLTVPIAAGIPALSHAGWSIYPNPATTSLHLCTGNSGPREAIALLYNAAGMEVLAVSLHGTKQTLDVSGLSKGIYQLVVSDENGATSSRVVVQ